MIGRETELRRLPGLVGEERLVTLTGPPGVGKTSLARAVVDDLTSEGEVRCVWCALDELGATTDVAGAVAGAAGFGSVDALLASITDQATVVVLDGCDHLVDAGLAAVVEHLLGVDGDVRVLATSRRPLTAADERLWVVTPLAVPEPGADLATNPSVALYLERCSAAGVEVAPTAAQLDVVGALVRELDGLPLAIELAAARVRSLGPGDLLARTDDQLDLLRDAQRRNDGAQRAMRSSLDVSYARLDGEHRALLRAMSVFPGPTAADLVHAVCGRPGSDEVETIDLLGDLIDCSLVTTRREPGGRVRYHLLNVVRRYAAEQLDVEGERDAVEERCIDTLAGMADAFAQNASDGWTAELVARMLGCYGNLLGTIELCLARDADGRRAFRLYLPLYSAIHGARAADVASLGRALLVRWPDGDEPWRAEVVATSAAAHLLAGRGLEAVELAQRALDHPTATALARLLAQRTLGFAAFYTGDRQEACTWIDRALVSAHEWGGAFRRELGVVRAALGSRDDGDAAIDQLHELALDCERHGEAVNQMWALVVLAHLLVRSGRTDAAEPLIEQARTLADRLDHTWGRGAAARLHAAHVAYTSGWDRARPAWREALEHGVRAGDEGAVAVTIDQGAAVAAAVGAADDAERLAGARLGVLARTILPSLAEGEGDDGSAAGATRDRAPSVVAAIRSAREALDRDDGPATEEVTTDGRARAATAAPASDGVEQASLVRVGDSWTVTFRGTTTTIRHSKGVADLARLVVRPDAEVHCLDLMDAAVVEGDTGPAIDAEARRAYEQRIRELQADIDEAAANHDTAREELAAAELDALVAQLSQAVGLGGRDRTSDATVDRARSAVRWRLRAAIDRLTEQAPELGRHLDRSIRTGVWCAYAPETPVTWTVDEGPPGT